MASPKRDKLLDCARKLFETEGFHTTGIDRILDSAGVAKMTLYNNFGSKDMLIVAVLEKASQDMIFRLEQASTQVSNDPYEQILAIFDALARWHDDPEFCGCMFQAAIAEFPDHDSKPALAAKAHFDRTTAMFEQMCRNAELPEPHTLSMMLGMLASGASCRARQTRTRQPADHARQIAEIILERACSTGFSPIHPASEETNSI